MAAYLYKMRLQIQVYLTYRFEVFASIVTKCILILANVFLWNSVYSGEAEIMDVSLEQMITYSVMSVCLSVMYQCGVQGNLNSDVRGGNIAVLLMKPMNLLLSYFSQDVGTIIVKAVSISLPIYVLGLVFLDVQLPQSVASLLLVVISYLLGFFIIWLLSALVSMFAFVTLELGNIGVVKDTIVAILSGSMIPVWFFPDKVEKLLMLTPFPYTYQTPLGLYIGKIGIQEGLGQIAVQLVWTLILLVMVGLAWNRAQDKVLIQGG